MPLRRVRLLAVLWRAASEDFFDIARHRRSEKRGTTCSPYADNAAICFASPPAAMPPMRTLARSNAPGFQRDGCCRAVRLLAARRRSLSISVTCPPIMPSTVPDAMLTTSRGSALQREPGSHAIDASRCVWIARVNSASPARIAIASPKTLWRVVVLPRRRIVVIERGQIVVDQRISMNHFQRGTRRSLTCRGIVGRQALAAAMQRIGRMRLPPANRSGVFSAVNRLPDVAIRRDVKRIRVRRHDPAAAVRRKIRPRVITVSLFSAVVARAEQFGRIAAASLRISCSTRVSASEQLFATGFRSVACRAKTRSSAERSSGRSPDSSSFTSFFRVHQAKFRKLPAFQFRCSHRRSLDRLFLTLPSLHESRRTVAQPLPPNTRRDVSPARWRVRGRRMEAATPVHPRSVPHSSCASRSALPPV